MSNVATIIIILWM